MALAALVASGCATPGPRSMHSGWTEVETAHFTILSRLDRERSVELARKLEIFRAAVERFGTSQSTESRVPTVLYVFDDEARFAPFLWENRLLGYLKPSMRDVLAAAVEGPRQDVAPILLHEYTHFLVRNAQKLALPRWYDEGLAEFMSTLEIEGGRLLLGSAPRRRFMTLSPANPDSDDLAGSKWIPVRDLIRSDQRAAWGRDGWAQFYAESWALVHYLQFRPGSQSGFADRMRNYLERLARGEPELAAFEAAFDLTLDGLDEELSRYLQTSRPRVSVSLSEIAVDEEMRVHAAYEERVALRLGRLAEVIGKYEQAEAQYSAALELHPYLSRAHAGLGALHVVRKEWERAEARYLRAMELDGENPLNHLDLAEYYQARSRVTDDDSARAGLLRMARQHYRKSYELEPSNPETYAMYGVSYLGSPELGERGLQPLRYARALLPADLYINRQLAEAYIELGRPDEALPLLRAALVWAHSGEEAEAIRRRLADLEAASPSVEGSP